MTRIVVVIPAFKPDKSLIQLLKDLKEIGFERIVVVDDGSGKAYEEIFQKAERLNCYIAVHAENRGKGAALKTGIQKAIDCFGNENSYITADADGQHLPKDIKKVADTLENNPDSLILGTRDFSKGNVPWKSLCGNRITSVFFRLTNGVSCPDTQTGLRGIPSKLEKLALTEEGSRYEYEMNFLTDASKSAPLYFVPIQTVYRDGNKSSHFRPIADSARIYGRFLRFIASSLTGAAVDYLIFSILILLLAMPQTEEIFLATVIARIVSGIVNFILNKHRTFHSRMPVGPEAARYLTLFIVQMCASAGLVSLFTLLLPAAASKLIVDTCLFFISFVIQKNWVFRKGEV